MTTYELGSFVWMFADILTRCPPAFPLGRHRGRGVEGTSEGVERDPMRRWRWRQREDRRMRKANEVETFQDTLTHLLCLSSQLDLRRERSLLPKNNRHTDDWAQY